MTNRLDVSLRNYPQNTIYELGSSTPVSFQQYVVFVSVILQKSVMRKTAPQTAVKYFDAFLWKSQDFFGALLEEFFGAVLA